jgi:hypothetical protein
MSVLGVDLNPPTYPLPDSPNVTFARANVEESWVPFAPDEKEFDFIFLRMLALGVRDWPGLFARAFTHLTPGSWIESQDTSLNIFAENATLEDSPALRWGAGMAAGAAALGFNNALGESKAQKNTLEAAGFINVVSVDIKFPIGPSGWTTDKEKKLAAMNLVNVSSFLRPVTDKVLASAPGISAEERDQLCEEARREITEESNKRFYLQL